MKEKKLSQINVPVTLKIEEIEATINDLIDGVLFENVNLADDSSDDLEIRAEKPENISLSFDSHQINYRVPLKLWVKKIIPITLVEVEVEGAIALSLSTEFKIENDWGFAQKKLDPGSANTGNRETIVVEKFIGFKEIIASLFKKK